MFLLSQLKSAFRLSITRIKIKKSLNARQLPILVHSMGKVGSTSLSKGLRLLDNMPLVLQTHFLTERGIASAVNTYKEWKIRIPNHIHISEYIRPHLNDYRYNHLKWHVATIVREPVAREISDVYQNPQVVGEQKNAIPNPDIVIDYLKNYFQNFNESTDYLCQWFDKEFIKLFDFPIYNKPFPIYKRYIILEKRNMRGLALRLEDLSLVANQALEEWLDRNVKFNIQALNTAHNRKSFTSYRKVKDNMKIKRCDLEAIYSTRYAKYFYSAMRQQLIERWAA